MRADTADTSRALGIVRMQMDLYLFYNYYQYGINFLFNYIIGPIKLGIRNKLPICCR